MVFILRKEKYIDICNGIYVKISKKKLEDLKDQNYNPIEMINTNSGEMFILQQHVVSIFLKLFYNFLM